MSVFAMRIPSAVVNTHVTQVSPFGSEQGLDAEWGVAIQFRPFHPEKRAHAGSIPPRRAQVTKYISPRPLPSSPWDSVD